jgi:hypothetical protein
MATLAHGDGAAGWVASLVNHSAWDIGLFPTRVQDDVFGTDPDILVCGSLAPAGTAVAVERGVRLFGRWRYVSGHCRRVGSAGVQPHLRRRDCDGCRARFPCPPRTS